MDVGQVCTHLIPHPNSELLERRVPLSSVARDLEFPGLKLSENQPASSVNLPKMIGLGLSGVKAGRQAQPPTATTWAAPAEPWPSAFPWKKNVCVQGTEWVGLEEREGLPAGVFFGCTCPYAT